MLTQFTHPIFICRLLWYLSIVSSVQKIVTDGSMKLEIWSGLVFSLPLGRVLLGEKTVRTINPQFSIHISFTWNGITLLTARIVINYHHAEEPELLREETFSLNTSSSRFRLIFLLVKQITGQPLKTDKCTYSDHWLYLVGIWDWAYLAYVMYNGCAISFESGSAQLS